jgi:hypothetical protein
MHQDCRSHARTATQPCSGGLVERALVDHRGQKRYDSKSGAAMAHLVDWHLLQRANTILMLGMLWSGLGACVLGALVYDVALWLGR